MEEQLFESEEPVVEETIEEIIPMKGDTIRKEMESISEFMIKNELSKENIKTAYNRFVPIAKYFFDNFLSEFKFNNVLSNINYNMETDWKEMGMDISFCSDKMNYERLSKILVHFNNLSDKINNVSVTEKLEKADTRSANGDLI